MTPVRGAQAPNSPSPYKGRGRRERGEERVLRTGRKPRLPNPTRLVIPAKAGTYWRLALPAQAPPNYDKRPLRRRPPHPLRWTPTGQSRARGNPDGKRASRREGRLILPHSRPKLPHFRPKTAPNLPHRQPDLTNGWCKMVQNGAALKGQGASEPAPAEIEEPHPAGIHPRARRPRPPNALPAPFTRAPTR